MPIRWLLVGSVLLLVACDGHMLVRDAGPSDDGGTLDGGPPPPIDAGDAGPAPDGGGVDGGGVDSGVPPGPSEASPPAEVTRTGTGGFLLRGTVLAPTGAIPDGEVLIVGNLITCVAASCATEPMADTVTVIDTHGVISPGLIDAHNHLTYDFLGEWVAGTTYDNRYIWSNVVAYEDWIAPFSDGRNLSERICPAAKWGELRSIIHGTTTVQGQSFNRTCLDRLARNADHFHQLGYDHMRTDIGSPRDITDADAATLVGGFTAATNPVTRNAVHMQEGVTGNNVLEEFESYAGRDPRTNRHMGTSLLAATDGSFRGVGLLIHAMGLTTAQLTEAFDTGAHIVWSPSSNLVLYGETAPIAEILAMGISVGIGPDWTVSGEDEMLGEMRFAYDYAQAESIAAITPEQLWRMATRGSAEAVGLDDRIGTLTVGTHADVTVFGRRGADPYRAVLDSHAQDVRFVLIDGAGYYGDAALEAVGAVNADCENVDACGTSKFLCAANTPGDTGPSGRANETVADIRMQLLDILAMYGRADLQELIVCE